MLGYDFFDKDNLSEEALMESEKCIVFLSTNALRVKTDLEDEYEDDIEEIVDDIDPEKLRERFELEKHRKSFRA